jgi:flagellar hook-length control protein FliK
MKVTGKAAMDSAAYSKTPDKTPASDRFSRILKDKDAARNGPILRPPLSGNPPVASQEDLVPRLPLPTTDVPEDLRGPRLPAGQIDVQKLAAEMVQEIHGAEKADGARSLDIQFNSKTLAGLHVHLELNNKALSIKFSTQSDKVAALLTNQANELRNALEASGLKVTGIVVSKGKTSGGLANSRQDRPPGGRN